VRARAALHFACQKGHVDAARTLITAGAKVQCRTAKGATPLHYAAQAGAFVVAEQSAGCG
jgi:ankyrin repeat protein